jgi:hypothetical protein
MFVATTCFRVGPKHVTTSRAYCVSQHSTDLRGGIAARKRRRVENVVNVNKTWYAFKMTTEFVRWT